MQNLTSYIGSIALALFVVYLTTNMLSFNNNIMEGMTSKSMTPDQIIQQLKTEKEKMNNSLLIGKYQTKYHEMLLDIEDILHLKMLEKLKSASENDKIDSEKTLKVVGELQNTKTALKDLDEFLTHYKTK
jgi:hypothetical protein